MKPRHALSRRLSKNAVGITFIPHLSQSDLNNIIDTHWEILNQHHWIINIKDFKDKKVAELFAVTKIVLINNLSFHCCKRVQVLKEIQTISFPKLKNLNLISNRIASIEPLSRIFLPELKQLWLQRNHITSLRSLRKCNFKLTNLNLDENKLSSIEGLEFMEFEADRDVWICDNPAVLSWSVMKWKTPKRGWQRMVFNSTLNVSHNAFSKKVDGIPSEKLVTAK